MMFSSSAIPYGHSNVLSYLFYICTLKSMGIVPVKDKMLIYRTSSENQPSHIYLKYKSDIYSPSDSLITVGNDKYIPTEYDARDIVDNIGKLYPSDMYTGLSMTANHYHDISVTRYGLAVIRGYYRYMDKVYKDYVFISDKEYIRKNMKYNSMYVEIVASERMSGAIYLSDDSSKIIDFISWIHDK